MPASGTDVWARFLPTAASAPGPAIRVSESANAQAEVELVDTGEHFLAVWRDYRNDDGDIYAARIGRDGALLDPAGTPVHAAGSLQRSPRAVADPFGVAVVWEERALEAQLQAKRATVEQYQALYDLRRSQKEALTVRASIEGVLQELAVEVGQEVTPGANLARVAQPCPPSPVQCVVRPLRRQGRRGVSARRQSRRRSLGDGVVP